MVAVQDEAGMINFICKNKKNTNYIQEYLMKLEQGGELEIFEVIPILTGVFSFYINQGTWKSDNHATDDIVDSTNGIDMEKGTEVSNIIKLKKAEKQVNLWLYSSYKAFIGILLNYFSHSSVAIQLKSLETLMEIIQTEYSANMQVNIKSQNKCKLNFPNGIFIKIVKQLFISEKLSKDMIQLFNSLLLEYDDLCFYSLRNIHSLLEKQNIIKTYSSTSECIAKNIYEILSKITSKNTDMENELSLYVDINDGDIDDGEIRKSYKNVLSSAWMALLHLPNLPKIIQKKILLHLDSKIMPHLTDPKLLIDFLTDTYDAGGVCCLLALNGLFVLINQYNLDYPEFYVKLYSLLDVSIFHTRYKDRFFYLLDLFLSSTHLPAYLVSAFVKKLARMALFTPGEDLFMLLKFIRNLLIRHASSRILIHRKNINDVEKTLETDPYIYNETDPFKSNASKSCLWELESLKSHYSKDILKLLFSFKKEFPLVEDDITDYFDNDFESLIKSKLDVEINEENIPPFNFEEKSELFLLDDKMWSL